MAETSLVMLVTAQNTYSEGFRNPINVNTQELCLSFNCCDKVTVIEPSTSCSSSIGSEVSMASEYRPLRSACHPAAAWPSDIHMVSGDSPDGNSDHRHQYCYSQTMDSDMAFGSSLGQYVTLASSYLPVPHHLPVCSSTLFHSGQTPQLHFLFSVFPFLHHTLLLQQVLGCFSSSHCQLRIFLYRKLDM